MTICVTSSEEEDDGLGRLSGVTGFWLGGDVGSVAEDGWGGLSGRGDDSSVCRTGRLEALRELPFSIFVPVLLHVITQHRYVPLRERTSLPLRQPILYGLAKSLVFDLGPVISFPISMLQSKLKVCETHCCGS